MANPRPNVDKAIFDTLNVSAVLAVATGGVHNSLAPANVSPPYCIFQAVSNINGRTLGKRYANLTYMVKGVSKSPWPKEAAEIDTEIDTLLESAALTVTGFTQVAGMCIREEDLFFVEEDGGQIWTHQGGLYRIELEEA